MPSLFSFNPETASEYYRRNENLQEVINEFGREFNNDKKKCREKERNKQQSTAYTFAGGRNARNLYYDTADWFGNDDDMRMVLQQPRTAMTIPMIRPIKHYNNNTLVIWH